MDELEPQEEPLSFFPIIIVMIILIFVVILAKLMGINIW